MGVGVAGSLFLAFALLFRGPIQGPPYVARDGSQPAEAAAWKHFALLSLLVSPGFVPANNTISASSAPIQKLLYRSVYINIRFLNCPFSAEQCYGSFLIGGERQGTMWLA